MTLGLLFFPIWIIVFVLLLLVVLFIFWVWALINCLTSRLNPLEKILWFVVIILFSILGAFLYLIFARRMEEQMSKKKTKKGKQLFRSKSNKVIGGVCGGIGKYFGIDPTVIRLLWVLFTFFSFGAAILAYIIAWIIVPEER